MTAWIDQGIIALYLVAMVAIGFIAGRGMKSLSQFSVAQRSFSWLFIMGTLSASFIGGGFSLGNAEKVFRHGLVNILALSGFAFMQLLVATFIAPRMAKFSQAISTGDIMGQVYGQPSKVATGIFSFLVCAGIMGAQVGAMGVVFEVFTGIPKLYGILIGTGIVLIYSTAGGMKADVITDMVQFVLLSIAVPVTLWLGVERAGGVQAVLHSVPATHLAPLGVMSITAFASLFLTFLLGETLVPPYVQRLLIGKSPQATARGTLLSGLLALPFFIVSGGIGLVALTLKPDLDPHTAFPYIVQQVLPIGVKGLVIVGVLSIVMSTADSFLNSAAVAVVNDVVNPLRRVPLNEQQGLRLAMVVNVVVGLLSIIFAISIPSLIDILIFAYNFWAPMMLVPLVFALLGGRSSGCTFFVSGAVGIISVLLWNYLLKNPGGIDGLIIGVFCNLCTFLLMRGRRPQPN